MSTPSKRRKKNDTSAQPVRSLDFFFGKQQAKKEEPVERVDAPDSKPQDVTAGDTAPAEGDIDGEETALTDEELARKLQAEWDEQDRLRDTNGNDRERHQSEEKEPPDKNISQPVATQYEDAIRPPEPKVNPFAAFGKKPDTLSLQAATAEDDTKSYEVPFDESPLTFDPQKYLPDLKSIWAADGDAATYALLTHGFVLVNSTQSRIKIVDTLVNLLRTIVEGDPDSLLPAVWLATNSISPPYIDLELGLGGSAISKALKKVCGLDNASLKKLYDKYGDAGDVAFEAKKKQSMTLRKPRPLTMKGVFESLVKIANAKGQGSVETKQRIVERLVQDARGAEESRYIVRTLVQHLRIGAVKTTMLIAR